MSWREFPDAIVSRVLLASVSHPDDVATFVSLERRIAYLVPAVAWHKAAAHAYLGQGVCAAVLCKSFAESAEEPDWKLTVERAMCAQFCCAPAEELCTQNSDRSGHAGILLKGSLLAIFGGVRHQSSALEHAQAIAELSVVDLKRLRWLAVCESVVPVPSPRWMPTLTDCGFSDAYLIGGQTYDGPGTGTPFADVWQLSFGTSEHSTDGIGCEWKRMAIAGCQFPARSCHTAVRAACGTLVLGGVGVEGRVLPCEAYCLQDNRWTLPQQSGLLPPQGAVHHACHYDGVLVLVGGVDDAGLQRRGLGRPTDVYVLNLTSWIWERLSRHPMSPTLHSFAAALVFGSRLFVVGGNSASAGGKSECDVLATLHLTNLASESIPGQAKQARWSHGVVLGISSQISGHSLLGGILLGGNHRTDGRAAASLFLPNIGLQQTRPTPTRRVGAPRWFKR